VSPLDPDRVGRVLVFLGPAPTSRPAPAARATSWLAG